MLNENQKSCGRNMVLAGRFQRFVRSSAAILLVVSSPVAAHPIEYHMQPLQAETVERMIVSLDELISELDRLGAVGTIRDAQAPDRRIPIWRIQAAVAAPTGGSIAESPAIRRAAVKAGYEDGPFVVEEWQLDANRVLDVYEALKNGTSAGDPAHDHQADYQMVSGYLEKLDASARRLKGRREELTDQPVGIHTSRPLAWSLP
jgi:hypothetical protein